jgi:hypothetical protein
LKQRSNAIPSWRAPCPNLLALAQLNEKRFQSFDMVERAKDCQPYRC